MGAGGRSIHITAESYPVVWACACVPVCLLTVHTWASVYLSMYETLNNRITHIPRVFVLLLCMWYVYHCVWTVLFILARWINNKGFSLFTVCAVVALWTVTPVATTFSLLQRMCSKHTSAGKLQLYCISFDSYLCKWYPIILPDNVHCHHTGCEVCRVQIYFSIMKNHWHDCAIWW